MPSSRKLTESMKESLESPFLTEEVLAAEPHHDFAPKIARLTDESPFATVSIQARTTDQVATESETNPVPWTLESEQSRGNESRRMPIRPRSKRTNFESIVCQQRRRLGFPRPIALPGRTQWPKQSAPEWEESEGLGRHHLFHATPGPYRRVRSKTCIAKSERDFFKLRAESNVYSTIVTRILKPSTKPTVFLPGRAEYGTTRTSWLRPRRGVSR